MASTEWFLNEVASVFSNLPIALYALGFRVQDGLVSAICNKAAAPMSFIGSVTDFKTIWDVKQTDLFGILGTGNQFHVSSLRHGNTFPLVNQAILTAAGCIEQPADVYTDLTLPRTVSVNITFLMPKDTADETQRTAKLTGQLVACLELSLLACSAILQALKGMYIGCALAICLAVSTFCYLALQQLQHPVYAHRDAIEKDIRLTTRKGAATDIHVIVPTQTSDEMYVVIGYTSQVHALTNISARVDKPLVLRWTCRVLGITLCVQAALLAKLIQAPPPALYGSPIWLASIVTAFTIRFALSKIHSRVDIPASDLTEVVRAPQIVLPARRSALAFISSLPVTVQKGSRWEWVDGFLPNNERRESWQQEMELSNLADPVQPNVSLSEDSRRIVNQVRDVRFDKNLVELIHRYETKVGLDKPSRKDSHAPD